MREQQNRHSYLQVDETPIRYLQLGAGKAPSGYFWVNHIPGGDGVYHWHPRRGVDRLDQVIDPNFKGTLQVDRSGAYKCLQPKRAGPIKLAACWAHARRKFYEAQELAPQVSAWILRQIVQLYRIEADLRYQQAGPALRLAVGSSQSAPIVRPIKKALIKLRARYLPKNKMANAIAYAMDQ